MFAARLTSAVVVILAVVDAVPSPPPAAIDTSSLAAISASRCHELKDVYKNQACCGHASSSSGHQVVPMPATKLFSTNKCAGKKPSDGTTPGDKHYHSVNCSSLSGVVSAMEQSAANVTKGYQGLIDASSRKAINTTFLQAGLCPVGVNFKLGAEHYSKGEFDEKGTGPAHRRLGSIDEASPRGLAAKVRQGYRCKKYVATNVNHTKPYHWQHCKGMHVGETYEVQWPHSKAGACGTPAQFQTPFHDGIFCNDGIISLNPLNTHQKIGVQAQVFTIVNDEAYFYSNLIQGMIVEGLFGANVAKYTGSTGGDAHSNTLCSKFTPITWHVDRKCHVISASSFDKLCADMKSQMDDMTADLSAHGSRELVHSKYAANNHVRRLSKGAKA